MFDVGTTVYWVEEDVTSRFGGYETREGRIISIGTELSAVATFAPSRVYEGITRFIPNHALYLSRVEAQKK